MRRANSNETNDKSDTGCSKKKKQDYDTSDRINNNSHINDDNDNGDIDNSESKGNDEEGFVISSEVIAKSACDLESNLTQNFKIAAFIRAHIDPISDSKMKCLKVSIEMKECKLGGMFNDNWPLLFKLGIGYSPDSVEIWVSPISNTFGKPLYKRKDPPLPERLELTNWGLLPKGCGVDGEGWTYKYKSDGPNGKFAPGKHSCSWFTSEAMSGFRIIIKQVLSLNTTRHKYFHSIRSKFRKIYRKIGIWRKLRKYLLTVEKWVLFPKMTHKLEMSIGLENFVENFESLKNSRNLHHDVLNFIYSEVSHPKRKKKRNRALEILKSNVHFI